MPLQYTSIVAEHNATREAVGVFDVSHLGKARVAGPGRRRLRQLAASTNDLGKIGPGQAQYTLCCTTDGGVVDDLIAYLVGDDEVFLIPNASNTARVVALLQAAAPGGHHGRRTSTTTTRSSPSRATRATRCWRALGAPVEHRLHALRRTATLAGVAGAGVPHRLHRRAGLRARRAVRGRRRRLGRRPGGGRAARRRCRAAWAPATRCAPRWATRCTATS